MKTQSGDIAQVSGEVANGDRAALRRQQHAKRMRDYRARQRPGRQGAVYPVPMSDKLRDWFYKRGHISAEDRREVGQQLGKILDDLVKNGGKL